MDRQDQRYFGRLAALLLGLAELAERAGGACPAVRCLVLWILRHAEAAARAYVIEAAGSPFPIVERTTCPDDASRLARNFRALAAMFRTLAHRARLAPESPGSPRGVILPPGRLSIAYGLRTLVALLARLIDTS